MTTYRNFRHNINTANRYVKLVFLSVCSLVGNAMLAACATEGLQRNTRDSVTESISAVDCRLFQGILEEVMMGAVNGEISVNELTATYRQIAVKTGSECEMPRRGITAAEPIPTQLDIEQSYIDDANRSFAMRSAAIRCGVLDPNSITGPLDWLSSPCVRQKMEMWQTRGNAPKLPSDEARAEAAIAKLYETSIVDKNMRYMSAQMTAWNRLTNTHFFYKKSLEPSSTGEKILDELRAINRSLEPVREVC